MDLTQEMIEQLKVDLITARTYQDLIGENGAIKKINKLLSRECLMQNSPKIWITRNTHLLGRIPRTECNGKTHKTLKNDNGEIELTEPRDRNGSFDPVVVKKYERTLAHMSSSD